jgi:iron(III) transport system ATP-binding protein
VINRGVIQQMGGPEDIYRHPVNQFVADFVGKVNFVHGEVVEDGIALKGFERRLPYKGDLKGKVVVAVRPENITMKMTETEGETNLRGVMDTMYYLGDVNDCRVKAGDVELRVIDKGSTYHELKEGETVYLGFKEFNVYPDTGDVEEATKIVT